MLPVATFAMYIGRGNYLEYGVAVAGLVLFNLIKVPLVTAPLFISDDSVFSIKNRLIECDSALDCFNKLILARPNIR